MNVERLALADAVEGYVADGDTVWIGNFGCQLFTVGHELIRQRRRHLHIVVGSGGLLLDQLLGAGVASEVTFAHCWSPVGPQPSWNFRRAWQNGSPIRWHEVSLATLNAALTAAAWGTPFVPVSLPATTGYLSDDWTSGMLAEVESPFGRSTVVRALAPDTAFVHAVSVDAFGNAVIGAPSGEAVIAAQAARRVVVVAEAVTAGEGAGPVTLPGVLVDTVVEAAGAARPDGVTALYPRDVKAHDDYVGAASTAEGFAGWLERILR